MPDDGVVQSRTGMSVSDIETGAVFAPKFDERGLIPVIASHAESGAVLMLAYMNEEALSRTLATGEAHYYSRRRQALWRKGESSGQIQRLVEMRVDCDQDTLWIAVLPQGDGGCCHVGYPGCFFRRVTPTGLLHDEADAGGTAPDP